MKNENKILLLDVLLFIIYCFAAYKTQQGFISYRYNWWFFLSILLVEFFMVDKRKWFTK